MFKLLKKKKDIPVEEKTDVIELADNVVRVNALLYRDRGYVAGDIVRMTIRKGDIASVFEGRIIYMYPTTIVLDTSSEFCAIRHDFNINDIVSIEPWEE